MAAEGGINAGPARVDGSSKSGTQGLGAHGNAVPALSGSPPFATASSDPFGGDPGVQAAGFMRCSSGTPGFVGGGSIANEEVQLCSAADDGSPPWHSNPGVGQDYGTGPKPGVLEGHAVPFEQSWLTPCFFQAEREKLVEQLLLEFNAIQQKHFSDLAANLSRQNAAPWLHASMDHRHHHHHHEHSSILHRMHTAGQQGRSQASDGDGHHQSAPVGQKAAQAGELERTHQEKKVESLEELANDLADTPLQDEGKSKEFKTKRLNALIKSELEGNHLFARVLANPLFEILSMVLILLNASALAFEVQYDGINIGYSLNVEGFDTTGEKLYPSASTVLDIISTTCTCLFTVELLLRLLGMKWKAFTCKWVLLDAVLVICGIFSELNSRNIVKLISVNPSGGRLIRLLRVLRFAEVITTGNVHALVLLVKSLQACGWMLIWSSLVLFCLLSIAGLTLYQLLVPTITSPSVDMAVRQEMFDYFGTYSRVLVTMMEVTVGNWVPIARFLMEELHEGYGLLLGFYRTFICFAVVSVIRAVFLTETTRLAASDDTVAMMRKERAAEQYSEKINDLFVELDDNDDGLLSWDEFEVISTDSLMKAYLATLELEPHDVKALFTILDDGDGYVDRNEFIRGVRCMKGLAKGIDMVTVLNHVKKIDRRVNIMQRTMVASMELQSFSQSACSKPPEENGNLGHLSSVTLR